MYFFNLKRLVFELKNGLVGKKEMIKYCLWLSVVSLLTLYNSRDFWSSINTVIVIINISIWLVIEGFGFYLCYRENNKGDGKDFLIRFISLYVVTGMRMALYIISIQMLALISMLFIGIDKFVAFMEKIGVPTSVTVDKFKTVTETASCFGHSSSTSTTFSTVKNISFDSISGAWFTISLVLIFLGLKYFWIKSKIKEIANN